MRKIRETDFMKKQMQNKMPKNFNPELFLIDLGEDITKLLCDKQDINHTYEEFVKILYTTLNHNAPYRLVSRNEQHTFQKPWRTKHILKSIGTKNAMSKKQIKSRIPCLIEQYRIYHNKLTHLKELSKN